MKQKQKEILQTLQSIFEIGNHFEYVTTLTNKLENEGLGKLIIKENQRKNYGKILEAIDNEIYSLVINSVEFEEEDIRQFDKYYLQDVTIQEIKEFLNVENLPFSRLKDVNGNPISYLWNFHYTERYGLKIAEELAKELKNNSSIKLTLDGDIVLAKQGYYTKFEIEKYSPTKNNYTNAAHRSDYGYNNYSSSDWLIDAAGTDNPETMNDVYWNID